MNRESTVVNKHFIISLFRATHWCRVVLFRQNVNLLTLKHIHRYLSFMPHLVAIIRGRLFEARLALNHTPIYLVND